MAFTHLEVHSHFTLLGATGSPAELAQQAAADGLSHLALTDSGVMHGAVAFGRACASVGIAPVIGLTVPMVDDQPAERPARLVLLARDVRGYRSLCHLSSLLGTSHAGSALGWDDLRSHAAGLICLSGGHSGWIERYLRSGERAAAQMYAGRLAGLYGEDACLAIQLDRAAGGKIEAGQDQAIAREVMAIAQRLGLAAVAVQPVYSLKPDLARLRLLAAIRCNCRVSEVPADQLPGGGEVEVHWLAPDEMARRYAAFPGTLGMSGEIAARCGPVLPDGRPIWPALPPDLLAGTANGTPDEALQRDARAGLIEKYGADAAPGTVERLAAELAAIVRHGYAPLFLAVADFVRWARCEGIPISTRGSVANSLVAFCAGITDVDPVANDLLFERFLSPARIDAPDIDIDACSRRRDEILAYVRGRYGPDRVALVGSISTLRLPSAVRETAKAYGLPEEETGRLLARLPHWHPRAGAEDTNGAVAEFLAAVHDPRWQAALADAQSIVGQPDHMSIHAGGLLITPCALADLVPVQMAPKGFLITQYEHGDLADLGLPKIDLLGIRALTVLADAAELVRRHYEPDFRLEDIPLDDPATGDLLARAETIGVFQCESDGARATLRKLRARTPRDLAIANAFFKPGPSTGGMAREFVKRYRGENKTKYLHPALEPILGPTKGVLIFQEQVLRIARELAGLSWEEADHLRRGMGRMRPAEMQALAERFVAGCQRPAPEGPSLPPDKAAILWEQVAAFGGFGFNQGHATAYAAVSYRSAYLRAHWPAAFLAARLADAGGFHHPAVYLAEAVRLGIAVHAPHVNHSEASVTLEVGRSAEELNPMREALPSRSKEDAIWLGLGQVRDLRTAAIEAIITKRQEQRFASLADLLQRVELQAKEVRHLIQCGALDGLGPSRAACLSAAEAQGAGTRAARVRRGEQPAARQLAFDFGPPEVDAVPAESAAERCAWEMAVLGLPVTALPDPLAALHEAERGRLPARVPLQMLLTGHPGLSVRSGGGSEEPWVAGMRLPGWPGGQGFICWDGASLVTARLPKGEKNPAIWQPILVRGHAARDEWGSTWLQVDELRKVGVDPGE